MNKIHLSSVDSTNAYLKRNYKNLDNLTFVSSDKQTNGKGRNDRVWKSENGKNLLFSLLILSDELINKYKAISLITAVSISQVLEELGINDVSIKWPNDVYVKDRKICGILLEAITTNKMECLIVGVGLNVNQINFNEEYLINPTSIADILNKEIDLEELKDKVYQKILFNLNNDDFYDYIHEHDYLKGKQAYALIDNEKELVDIVGINSNYSLKIKRNNSEIYIESGEISFHI